MGMYTELIFGASLRKDTPEEVIHVLQFLIGDRTAPVELPNHPFFGTARYGHIFSSSSYYFGVSRSLGKMWTDEISNEWVISTRSNLKNYDGEVELFLDWIKPYISKGSGSREFYAISCYEQDEPNIYYL